MLISRVGLGCVLTRCGENTRLTTAHDTLPCHAHAPYPPKYLTFVEYLTYPLRPLSARFSVVECSAAETDPRARDPSKILRFSIPLK